MGEECFIRAMKEEVKGESVVLIETVAECEKEEVKVVPIVLKPSPKRLKKGTETEYTTVAEITNNKLYCNVTPSMCTNL